MLAIVVYLVSLFECCVSRLSEAKSRALDNLGRVYARIGNFQKAIDVYVCCYSSAFIVCLSVYLLTAKTLVCQLLLTQGRAYVLTVYGHFNYQFYATLFHHYDMVAYN